MTGNENAAANEDAKQEDSWEDWFNSFCLQAAVAYIRVNKEHYQNSYQTLSQISLVAEDGTVYTFNALHLFREPIKVEEYFDGNQGDYLGFLMDMVGQKKVVAYSDTADYCILSDSAGNIYLCRINATPHLLFQNYLSFREAVEAYTAEFLNLSLDTEDEMF